MCGSRRMKVAGIASHWDGSERVVSREEEPKLLQSFAVKVSNTSSPHTPRCMSVDYADAGTAIFCLLSEHMTVILQRLEVPIARKIATGTSAHEKGLAKFYSSLYSSFLRHIPYSNPSLRAIVIASPGWVRDAVFDYIMAEASRTGNKALLGARNKFLKVHVNSPHVHSLVEVLKSPEVRCQESAITQESNASVLHRSSPSSRRRSLQGKV